MDVRFEGDRYRSFWRSLRKEVELVERNKYHSQKFLNIRKSWADRGMYGYYFLMIRVQSETIYIGAA